MEIKTLIHSLVVRNKISNSIFDFFISTRLRYYLLLMRNEQKLIKNDQQEKNYFELRKKFKKKFDKLKGNYESFITPPWISYEKELKKVLLPYPKFNFLQEVPILKGMFGTKRDEWFSRILSNMPEKVSKEDYIGEPLLYDSKYLSSQNLIEHYLHIKNFKKYIKSPTKRIVEWGGGYGSMARMLWRLGEVKTYVSIDLPIVCALQWFYLSIIFGEENVYLFQDPNDKIKEGKMNIVPVFWVDSLNFKPDLFISTWALSESSKEAQDFVVRRNWFNAKHFLLAFTGNRNRFPDSNRLRNLAKNKGALIRKVDYSPGNYYAFL